MTPDPTQLPLKDLHLPDAISWWPLAPGWWGVLVITLLSLLIGYLTLRWWRKGRLKRQAVKAFATLESDYQTSGNQQQYLTELSILLRRIAISSYPTRDVASLAGDAWLSFLDQAISNTNEANGFSQGAGQVLAVGPYAGKVENIEQQALGKIVSTWIKQATRGGRNDLL